MNTETMLEIHARLDAVLMIDRAVSVYKDPMMLIWCPSARVRSDDWYALRMRGADLEPMTREQALRHRARHMARVQDLVVKSALDVAGDIARMLVGSVVLRARRMLGLER